MPDDDQILDGADVVDPVDSLDDLGEEEDPLLSSDEDDSLDMDLLEEDL